MTIPKVMLFQLLSVLGLVSLTASVTAAPLSDNEVATRVVAVQDADPRLLSVAVSSADDRDGFPTLLSSMLLLANTTIGCS